jgi:cellulose synthase/poly-beta-1,6-N-acetylglucosamine synthase-like glycosyltransferase
VCLAVGLGSLFQSLESGTEGLSLKTLLLFVTFCCALLSLFYGNLVYQLTRLGQLSRQLQPDQPARHLSTALATQPARVSILVPSYREQIPVVMQTLLSAALSEYPDRRLTLLIDDPPTTSGPALRDLNATRALVTELDEFFREAAQRFQAAAADYNERSRSGHFEQGSEREILAGLYENAADLVENIGARYTRYSNPAFAHADKLFMSEVIGRLVREHRERAADIRTSEFYCDLLSSEYRRLAYLFAVPIDCFERKRFANLSHSPNKAMNLNSYIALIGRAFRITKDGAGAPMIVECMQGEADIVIPPADYVVTIDADSVVLPEYVGKLLAIAEADPSIAIVQTPYSAYPGAPTVLERVAGATTDIQYLVHQGFTAFNATFWVGANAVLRFSALEDIRSSTIERGHEVSIFIQDRTLIEDTGSSIDLVAKGWRLHNHPERLAYSATPPDFGALVIQRRRWANGGLIIFPSLLQLWLGPGKARAGSVETFVRSHYLLSPALANISLLLLLVIPFGRDYSNIWFPLAAAPYYLCYGRDLVKNGYKWRDVFRVYALTLLLIPINLAGVYASVKQIITGHKAAFARTPKIDGRTAAPRSHLLCLAALLLTAVVSAVSNLWLGSLLFFAFSAVNAAFFFYGFVWLIGWREALTDITGGWRDRTVGSYKQFAAGAVYEVTHRAVSKMHSAER